MAKTRFDKLPHIQDECHVSKKTYKTKPQSIAFSAHYMQMANHWRYRGAIQQGLRHTKKQGSPIALTVPDGAVVMS